MTWRALRRKLLAFHRWLGGLSAVFLIVVSLTGLALNHTELLGLDNVAIRSPFVLKRYGMSTGADIVSAPLKSGEFVSRLGGRIYWGAEPLATGGALLGIREEADYVAVVTDADILLLMPDGELVEQLEFSALPMETVTAVGATPAGAPVLVEADKVWLVTDDWLDFEPYVGDYSVAALKIAPLPDALRAELLDSFQGDGVPLYRVVLDLHSGRLFGWPGRTLMDLSAVAVIILVSTGLVTWLRTTRGRNKREEGVQ